MKAYSVFILLCIMSCSQNDDTDADSIPPFSSNMAIGRVQSELLNEVSGIVSSKSLKDALWAHNDRGDGARIFLLDESGEHLGIFNLEGIAARDWEDIAIGPGPQPGVDYIYVADIGDNDEISNVLYVYRFPEPDLSKLTFPTEQNISDVDVIEMVFNDKARDAETLLVDPISKSIYIVTKRTKSSKVYQLAFPQSTTHRNVLQYVIDLPFSSAVGGDISSDGNEILIKSYDSIYYWKKNSQESINQLFFFTPITLPYKKEPRGEAITWRSNNSGFYSISEEVDNKNAVIYFYNRN